MNSRHDRRILDLFGIDLPVLQAPMAGVSRLAPLKGARAY